MLFDAWSEVPKPIIGMLHLMPLPGAPLYGRSVENVRTALLRDAERLAMGNVNGFLLENFGDVPFYPGRVPAHVIAHMTALAAEVKRQYPALPLGINVLRNDGLSALAVAQAVGAQFIRVNVLAGARVADQGLIQGIAHDLLRLRRELDAQTIKIFADVDVKHSAALAERSLQDEVDDVVHRGLADALIVSGTGTGKPTDPLKLREVKSATKRTPVFLGSGVSPLTIGQLIAHADGFIVGTYFKENGDPTRPVDPQRVKHLMASMKQPAT